MSQEQWTAVDDYLSGLVAPNDAALAAALANSAGAGLPSIHITPNQGKLLFLLARLRGARAILEIGTLGGYSAIWLARALPSGGRLITLEHNPEYADVARRNLERAGLMDRVEIRVGEAIDTLAQLSEEGHGPFDLVFIDADKRSNPTYVSRAIELAREGSVIIVDNVVRNGSVLDAESEDESVQGVRRALELMASEPRLAVTAIQTVGSKGYDGFAIALVV